MTYRGFHVALAVALGLAAVTAACDRNPDIHPETMHPATAMGTKPPPELASAALATAIESADAPRRGYGSVDMRVHPCMSLEADNVMTGKACPTGIVVFGPYVAIPANADVEVAFEVETTGRLAVVSDMVSDSANVFHGALLEQSLEPGTKQRFGYRIHVFKPTASLETRIFVRADNPVDFKIRDLVVNVR